MAIIYGAPVILLQKLDTSEQWLINASPDVASLIASTSTGQATFKESFTSNNNTYNQIQFFVG